MTHLTYQTALKMKALVKRAKALAEKLANARFTSFVVKSSDLGKVPAKRDRFGDPAGSLAYTQRAVHR